MEDELQACHEGCGSLETSLHTECEYASETVLEILLSELILHVGSVGDAKSLIVHPASTTHSQLSPEEQVAAGVYPNMLRLSVGIENVDDLIADLAAAL